MHLETSLILAIASSALALPAINQTGSNLAKRYNWGWIGSFEDEHCSGKPVGPRPELHYDCVAFTPSMSAGFVGIFPGTGVLEFDQLAIYVDNKCHTPILVDAGLDVDDYELPKAIQNSGSFACMSSQDFAGVGGVQAYGYGL